MSYSDNSLARVIGLYRNGGFSEVRRGIRDWLTFDAKFPMHRVIGSRTLSVGDVGIEIRTTSREAYWRVGGHYETAARRDFVERVQPADVVWDVGANIGVYSLLAAAVGAEVVAFEPGAKARGELVANAIANGTADRIDATPYALSDYDGSGTLLGAERMGVQSLGEGDGDTVPVRRGDGVDVPAPDVLKMDVEGAEVAALDGLGDLLDGCRTVYVECHEGVDRDAVTQRLEDAQLTIAEWFDDIVRADR